LLLNQTIKEERIALEHSGGPLFVLVEQGFEKAHIDFVYSVRRSTHRNSFRERSILSHYPMGAYATMNVKIRKLPPCIFKSLDESSLSF
jgi:hypothetical protein